ncbi:MAG: citrate synthase [Oscillospiraceae bacterium]|nr:citrate synthase [Oscillospiraceae bacterium]
MSDKGMGYDPDKDITLLCEESRKYNYIPPEDFIKNNVKRGLRNADGTGVVAGITKICNVEGYEIQDGKKVPVPGKLIYRGIDVEKIVNACICENRFGFEETSWLLLYGHLPNKGQLESYERMVSRQRELPDFFVDNVIMKSPSGDIMNALQRAVLALYSYDENADDISLENVMRQAISIIARIPSIMVSAYQVKRRHFDRKSMHFHHCKEELSTAENILRTLRSDKQFTDEEAKTLDLCMVLHAEHGGGNNSTFSARVLTSSATDTYSAISAGIGSLKGPRHGGANQKVMEMMECVKEGVSNWEDEAEIQSFLRKIMDKKAGDGAGLIYGMGHAIYTISDPRASILREYATKMAEGTEYEKEFNLLRSVEKLSPEVFRDKKGIDVPLCANVDLYSGLVYTMLKLPPELFTPIFAISRTVGWCAHRIEEILTTGGKIIRPAYKAVSPYADYTDINDR